MSSPYDNLTPFTREANGYTTDISGHSPGGWNYWRSHMDRRHWTVINSDEHFQTPTWTAVIDDYGNLTSVKEYK